MYQEMLKTNKNQCLQYRAGLIAVFLFPSDRQACEVGWVMWRNGWWAKMVVVHPKYFI